ncbi:MAG: hypothetical protein M5U28_40515 [Sandaracinaceae bacterium]|nr:hypothetical protein [Sandaracinaceae bacterium]
MIELTEREARWDLHVDALRRRVGANVPPLQRRLDLARIASTQAGRLEHVEAAIETWHTITEQFGEDHESVGRALRSPRPRGTLRGDLRRARARHRARLAPRRRGARARR